MRGTEVSADTVHQRISIRGCLNRLVRAIFRRLSDNRFIRTLLSLYFYRKWVLPCEATIAVCKRQETLDEFYWMGKLRQYAHIIDKGLHRQDVSRGHGERVCRLAKNALTHIQSPWAMCDPSVKWAAEKIRLYEEYQSGESAGIKREYTGTTCKYEDLLNAIKTRRSIRYYLNKPVPTEIVEAIADVVDWSPTSCDRQPARIYATNEPDTVRQCVELHAGAACFAKIYAPLFLTFCADARLYALPAELAMPYIDVALGAQNCVLVAHTLGISLTLLTCGNWKDWQEHKFRNLLGIPQHLRIVVSAVGGYPDGGAEVPARKNRELFTVG